MSLLHTKPFSKVFSGTQNPSLGKSFLFYVTLLSAMLFFVLLQPLGEPPDETGRYLIVQYICIHGTLPNGADPEILLYGYGGSYGFQPMLTYIIQGYLLRFVFQFCKDGYVLIVLARLVNVVFGMIMAVYVRKIAKLLFEAEPLQWLFSILVMFLPQSLFLHTYVNTDSMAMMACAIMIYAWLLGLQTDWNRRACLTLSIGISLCAHSYYNAYSIILCSMLLFVFSFVRRDASTGKLTFQFRMLLQKGIFISAIVLVCIGWWFIRNAILYDGDFLGLAARAKCTLDTATEQYHPLTKKTYYNTGYSLWYMIFQTDFLELLTNSSIATFGPMSIVTFKHIYTVVKWLCVVSFGGLFLPMGCRMFQKLSKKSPAPLLPPTGVPASLTLYRRVLLHVCMALGIALPILLCTVYSYRSDYQPQGRYILPMLLPFCYFMVLGLSYLGKLLQNKAQQFYAVLSFMVTVFYEYMLWATLLLVVFRVYYTSSPLHYFKMLF